MVCSASRGGAHLRAGARRAAPVVQVREPLQQWLGRPLPTRSRWQPLVSEACRAAPAAARPRSERATTASAGVGFPGGRLYGVSPFCATYPRASASSSPERIRCARSVLRKQLERPTLQGRRPRRDRGPSRHPPHALLDERSDLAHLAGRPRTGGGPRASPARRPVGPAETRAPPASPRPGARSIPPAHPCHLTAPSPTSTAHARPYEDLDAGDRASGRDGHDADLVVG